jgi:hypothetical protein
MQSARVDNPSNPVDDERCWADDCKPRPGVDAKEKVGVEDHDTQEAPLCYVA